MSTTDEVRALREERDHYERQRDAARQNEDELREAYAALAVKQINTGAELYELRARLLGLAESWSRRANDPEAESFDPVTELHAVLHDGGAR